MRKLIVAEHISLDGVIQAPGGPKEDPSNGFRFGGWEAPFDNDAIGEFVMEMFSQPFELLLGRHTYDIWAAYWPHSGPSAIADKFNAVPKHVATHRPDNLPWKNSFALKGHLPEAVRELKKKDGPSLLTWGSSDMVRQLLAEGLVDELQLLVYPVVLGKGKRLFDEKGHPNSFKLIHSVTCSNGVFLARYSLDGEVKNRIDVVN